MSPMKRVYALDVHELREGGVLKQWFSKGHQDPADFLIALVEGHNPVPGTVGEPRWEWRRTVYDLDEDDGSYYLLHAVPGSRGAFPVTIADCVEAPAAAAPVRRGWRQRLAALWLGRAK